MNDGYSSSTPTSSFPEYAPTGEPQALPEDTDAFLWELRRSKQELDTARKQFDYVVDSLLIDHIVFRLGAAERHFNYLFQLARKMNLSVQGVRWDLAEDE